MQDFALPADLDGMLTIVCIIIFVQRWACIELRRAYSETLVPAKLVAGLYWYRANSFLGLIANAVILLAIFELLGFPIGFRASGSAVSIGQAFPAWQLILVSIIGAPLLLLAYYWSRAEYFIGVGGVRPVTALEIMRQSRDLRFPERLIGLLCFLFLSVWCVLLLFDVKYLARIAAFPDGSVGTLGFGVAWMVIVLRFLFWGVIPWLAVYRGLPLLFNYDSLSIEGGNRGRE